MKNRLEELRKQRGIKQEDLANALEAVSYTHLDVYKRQHVNRCDLMIIISRIIINTFCCITTGRVYRCLLYTSGGRTVWDRCE